MFGILLLCFARVHYLFNHAMVQVYGYDTKLEFFAKCDFVVCSLPGTPETYHFCNAEVFEAMKNEAVFVSIGRGR